MWELAQTPEPPYYAVIFTSIRKKGDEDGYAATAARMDELAKQQPGYLGIDSARAEGDVRITVSYWQSLESIANWKANMEHLAAQKSGRQKWYEQFTLRIAKVDKAYRFAARENLEKF